MRRAIIIALGIAGCHLRAAKPVEWEHGWKTERVIATRYKNEQMGYTIGFTYPKNPNDCDRAELSDFMEAYDGWIYQSGGSPGAEMFVRFEDVTDKTSANKKLFAILPLLDSLIWKLGAGIPVKVQKVKRKIIGKDGRDGRQVKILSIYCTWLRLK